MKEQQDFDNIAPDIKNLISNYLTYVELKSLALTNHRHTLFFKSKLVVKLLQCIDMGDEDKVERILKISPELLIQRTIFTDSAGRVFTGKGITAFEFILWALDTGNMLDIMLNSIPHNEFGHTLLETLKAQYETLESNGGINYVLDGKPQHEQYTFIRLLRHEANKMKLNGTEIDYDVLVNLAKIRVQNYDAIAFRLTNLLNKDSVVEDQFYYCSIL